VFRGIRISGERVVRVSLSAYTGASPALSGAFAYFGTFSAESGGSESEVEKNDLAL
jgi:hypothetical protein